MVEIWGIFLSGFLASTLLPGGSEIAVVYAASEQLAGEWEIWAAATIGNTLGGLTSWLIGWWIIRKFPESQPEKGSHVKALAHIRRYGSPALLFSWLPVVGDPLCLAAGWLRINLLVTTLLLAIGKGARYAVLIWWVQ